MKKSIIAAGAASVALAAMPIVGAFAMTGTPVNDNITATIEGGCTITDGIEDKYVSLAVAPGTAATSAAASSISVTCNNATWAITAVGSTEVDTEDTTGTTTDLIAKKEIPPVAEGGDPTYEYYHINTSSTSTDSASNWKFKVSSISDSVNGQIVTGFGDFTGIPNTETAIVRNSTAAATETVNTQYRVYAALGQQGGEYTGRVTYSVVDDIADL